MIELLFAPLYAAADRVYGMERSPKWKKRPLKAIILAVLMGAGFILSGWIGVAYGAAWSLIYRPIPWSVFGGSMDAKNAKEAFGMLLRHLIAVPCLCLPAYWLIGDWRWALMASVVYAFFATLLAVLYGMKTRKGPAGEFNTIVEIARGFAFGVSIFAIIRMGNAPFVV